LQGLGDEPVGLGKFALLGTDDPQHVKCIEVVGKFSQEPRVKALRSREIALGIGLERLLVRIVAGICHQSDRLPFANQRS